MGQVAWPPDMIACMAGSSKQHTLKLGPCDWLVITEMLRHLVNHACTAYT